MKLLWLTDIHLNFLNQDQIEAFLRKAAENQPDAVLLSGDIGESGDVTSHLRLMESAFACPIYFVLGNHDFYGGGIDRTRATIADLTAANKNLFWLSGNGVVKLTDSTALIGHDSWADGRYGDYERSRVMLNDYIYIKEFLPLTKAERLDLMRSLAQEAADHIEHLLPKALNGATTVIALMHAPPFRRACRYRGLIGDDEHLPHYSTKVVGDILRTMMIKHPRHKLVVLCGHTHDAGEYDVLDNLEVNVGGATYGDPRVQKIIDIT